MGQDYYPRLSAASDDRSELLTLINQQLYLLFILLSPIILWLLFLSPMVVPLLYSDRFVPAASILNWFLIGDIFRLLSWTLSFVILARSKSSLFFLTELFGGAALLVTGLAGMRFFGATGLGISYLSTTFAYYLLVTVLVHRQLGLKYDTKNKLLVTSTLISALVISVLTSLGYEVLRTCFALAACLVYSAFSFFTVVKQFRREGVTEEPAVQVQQ